MGKSVPEAKKRVFFEVFEEKRLAGAEKYPSPGPLPVGRGEGVTTDSFHGTI